MPTIAPALLVALALGGHSRSEGTSRFELLGQDRIAIAVELSVLDLPELCDVDLTLSDPERRRAEARRLDACVEAGYPRWLRLATTDGACTLSADGVESGESLVVALRANAVCPPLPGSTLTIDWGFFSGQRLEHMSVATVVVEPGRQERALLSRRHNRLTVQIPWSGPAHMMLGGAVLAAASALVWCARSVGRRRRERLRAGQTRGAP
jgi:hypothetical protein